MLFTANDLLDLVTGTGRRGGTAQAEGEGRYHGAISDIVLTESLTTPARTDMPICKRNVGHTSEYS